MYHLLHKRPAAHYISQEKIPGILRSASVPLDNPPLSERSDQSACAESRRMVLGHPVAGQGPTATKQGKAKDMTTDSHRKKCKLTNTMQQDEACQQAFGDPGMPT